MLLKAFLSTLPDIAVVLGDLGKNPLILIEGVFIDIPFNKSFSSSFLGFLIRFFTGTFGFLIITAPLLISNPVFNVFNSFIAASLASKT